MRAFRGAGRWDQGQQAAKAHQGSAFLKTSRQVDKQGEEWEIVRGGAGGGVRMEREEESEVVVAELGEENEEGRRRRLRLCHDLHFPAGSLSLLPTGAAVG